MQTQDEPKLKPCAFCGRPGQYKQDEERGIPVYTVFCGQRFDEIGCFASITYDHIGELNILFSSKKEAAEQWNKRATE